MNFLAVSVQLVEHKYCGSLGGNVWFDKPCVSELCMSRYWHHDFLHYYVVAQIPSREFANVYVFGYQVVLVFPLYVYLVYSLKLVYIMLFYIDVEAEQLQKIV